MIIQIWSVPNYRGGRSYVSYSPDGIYKLDYVFTKSTPDSVRIFSLVEDNRVVAISPSSPHSVIAVRPSWLYLEESSDGFFRKIPCYGHKLEAGDSDTIVDLPPSWWRQLHAWLTIRLKGLEDPQLKIVEISKRYPPVDK